MSSCAGVQYCWFDAFHTSWHVGMLFTLFWLSSSIRTCCALVATSRHSLLRSFDTLLSLFFDPLVGAVAHSLHSFHPSPSIWTGCFSVRARRKTHRHSFNFVSFFPNNGTSPRLSHHSFADPLSSSPLYLVSLSTLACSHLVFVLVLLAALWR